MRSKIFKILALLTAVFAIAGGLLPQIAWAQVKPVNKTATAKKVVLAMKAQVEEDISEAESASRCLIASIKDAYAKAVKIQDADIEKRGVGHAGAVDEYRYRIDMAWQAMHLPYCGYGSKNGLSDEVHSFKKSVERARADFLKDTK